MRHWFCLTSQEEKPIELIIWCKKCPTEFQVHVLYLEQKGWNGICGFALKKRLSLNWEWGVSLNRGAVGRVQCFAFSAGKYLVGKSFTTNSLLNEEAAKRQFMNREASPPIAHTREAHGFTLSIIDTGGVTEVDLLSTAVSFTPPIFVLGFFSVTCPGENPCFLIWQ